jgi:hypothetical protein
LQGKEEEKPKKTKGRRAERKEGEEERQEEAQGRRAERNEGEDIVLE